MKILNTVWRAIEFSSVGALLMVGVATVITTITESVEPGLLMLLVLALVLTGAIVLFYDWAKPFLKRED